MAREGYAVLFVA
ncbi:hypothetical protein CGLO_17738 [Colletotrichum gloeosporioides Cg-14]|uniref:Uncharacterized protein n=1 Tax=Colletotrichum gloeosporioides (strain Cg-14) TaxID=1237896 RepID=T0KW91_COLGC|nr:hypothetical protein CGLO_17738 [Colletotrichum gloeosporioides Cg-14]